MMERPVTPIEAEFAATDLGWLIVCHRCGGDGLDAESVEAAPCPRCFGQGLVDAAAYFGDDDDDRDGDE